MPVLMALALPACGSDPTMGMAPMDGAAEDTVVARQPVDAGDVTATMEDLGARDAPRTDQGSLEEATAPTDTGETDAPEEPDSGSPMDVGSPTDVGSPVDSGAPVDVGSPMDSGAPADVGAPVDVGADIAAPRDSGALADAVAPRDAGTAPVDAGTVPAVTGVPRIDATLKAAMRAVYLRGLAAGNRAAVFAKIGDSITESQSFLTDFGPASGTPSWNLGSYTALEPTRAFFNATLVDESHSSFDRASRAAVTGWTSGDALDDGAMLLRQELTALHPSVAIVMFGSADIDVTEVGTYRSNLTRVVQIILAANVIPVLSTIPNRTDSPTTSALGPSFVSTIREVAAAQHVPLQDYWAALEPLPHHGVSEDGVHPSLYRVPGGGPEAAYFTPEALAYGYNVRNLQTLATLAHVRAVVFNDGPADP